MHSTKDKRNAYMRERYATNRETLAVKQKEWRDQRREWAVNQLGGKCVKCGNTDDLQFDHIDPTTKTAPVGKLYYSSIEKLMTELPKCQLLCGNCHRRKTIENGDHQQGSSTHGSLRMYTRYGCRCERCLEAMRKYQREWKARKRSQSKESQS